MGTITRRVGLAGLATATALAASILVAVPAQASTDLVADLRASQVVDAERGDVIAQENLRAIDALTQEERFQLSGILTEGESAIGEIPADAKIEQDGNVTIASDGAEQWVTEAGVEPVSPMQARAAVGTRSIWATQTYSFAGISLTQIKTWGKYTVQAPRVLKVTDWGTQVVKNYQPLTSASSSKQSAVISGGDVTFKAKVTVKRGPTPGLGGNWSSKTSYHTVKANYIGTIKANTWT